MRLGLTLFLAAMVVACASASPPPGGPEDKIPPRLVRVSPDTNSVNFHDKVVSFYFDETINDRGTGAQELDNFFLLSPSDGAANLNWHRSRIDIAPRHGFKPNTAYTVTVLPGMTDLSSNVMKAGATVVFSTGPVIPTTKIEGIAFDWSAGTPVKAYVEAITADSTVYLSQSDSGGKFTIGPLGPGSYLVRAIMDQNNNRTLDRNEAFDTLRVLVPQQAPIQLLAAPRDTLPALMGIPTAGDSVTINIVFDRLLDPTQPIDAAAFRLIASDSVQVPIVGAYSPAALRVADSLRAKVTGDSVRRADSLAGKAAVPPTLPPAIAPAPAPGKAPPPPPPKPRLPSPFNSITLKLGRPIKPSTEYRLSTTGLRALSGKSVPSDRRFTTPKPPPPPPPKPAAKDSGAAVPKVPVVSPTPPVATPKPPSAR